MGALLAVLLLFVGALCLMFGVLGRRVGDEPRCRGCRFDLTGVGGVCPECGAELGGPRSVVHGTRRRRPVLASIGALVLLAGVGAGWLAVATVDLNTYKPTWWLAQMDARRPAGPELDAAMNELVARIAAGSASERAVRPAIKTALRRQGDRTLRWSNSLGDVFEAAWTAGWVDEDDRLLYLKQAVAIEVWALFPELGGEARISIGYVRDRAATYPDARIGAPLQFVLEGGEIVGRDGGSTALPPMQFGMIASGTQGLDINAHNLLRVGHFTRGLVVAKDLPPGAYTVRTRWKMRIDLGIDKPDPGTPGWSANFSPGQFLTPDAPGGSIEWVQSFEAATSVFAPAKPRFVVLDDPAVEPEVRRYLRITRVSKRHVVITGTLVADARSVPVNLDHYLVVRQGGLEWELSGNVFLAARDPSEIGGPARAWVSATVVGMDADKPFDLMLRPNPAMPTHANLQFRKGPPPPLYGRDVVIGESLRVD